MLGQEVFFLYTQANHYYPFGMTFGEGINNSDNRYKYNGKGLLKNPG